jgi:hypothetical protein
VLAFRKRIVCPQNAFELLRRKSAGIISVYQVCDLPATAWRL